MKYLRLAAWIVTMAGIAYLIYTNHTQQAQLNTLQASLSKTQQTIKKTDSDVNSADTDIQNTQTDVQNLNHSYGGAYIP